MSKTIGNSWFWIHMTKMLVAALIGAASLATPPPSASAREVSVSAQR